VLIAGLAVGGAIGAMARFLVDGRIKRATTGPFPWGTFVINVTGSLVLGVVVGLAQYHGLGGVSVAAIGTGFCGGFTTFSTYSYESIRLLERGSVGAAAANTIGSVVVGLLVAGAAIGFVAAV
jgi:fluoride exporter